MVNKMTPLQALERLATVCTPQSVYSDRLDLNSALNEDFKIVRKALTPPTADEVCEVLKEDTGYETVYNWLDLSFTIHCPMYYDYIMLESDGKVWISYDKLSLKSLSIISRFYEAQE